MDNRQLQIFHAVVSEGSFTAAARRLHMAQPAVSIAVRKLEEELQVQLFSRAERRIQLTAEGGALLRHTERILEQFQQARLELAELRGLAAGAVRLGTSAMMGAYFFPPLIAGFRRRYPQIRVEISGEGTRRARQLILDGEIDMGIVNMADVPSELEAHLLVREEVVACVPPGHPFTQSRAIGMDEFTRQPLIVYREGYYLREMIESLSQAAGVVPNLAVETNLLRLMISLVCQGQGVGFCLKRVIEQESGLRGVSFREPLFLDLGIAWKRKHYLSRANRAFVAYVLEALGQSPLENV